MSRSTALRLLVLALIAGVASDVLFRENAIGINAPVWILLVVVAGTLVAGRRGLARLDPWDRWLAPVAIALTAFVAVRTDASLVLVDLALATAAAGAWLVALGGRPVTRASVDAVGLAAAMLAAGMVIGVLPALRAARPLTRSLEGRVRIDARFLPVIRGLAIAVPLLLVFAALFAAADGIFARVIESLTSFELDLDDLPQRMIFVAVIGWAVGGALVLATGDWGSILGDGATDEPPPAPRGPLWGQPPIAAPAAGPAPAVDPATTAWSSRAAMPPGSPATTPSARSLGAAAAVREHGIRIGEIEATVVLVAIDALFAVFVVLQLAYLFGGLDTLAASGRTYANYARRGFFELLTVAGLSGALVAGLEATVRRRTAPYLIASFGLLGLTALVLASSFLRLRLYQDAYGWTELRFWVVLSIGWVAVSIAALTLLVLRDRSRWVLHAMAVLGIVAVGVANALGPQAFVADRNLERALDPSLVPADGSAGLDAEYLASLGDDAIPAVVAAYPRLAEADRAFLGDVLEDRAVALVAGSYRGWPAWNLARTRAREALATWDR